MFIKTITKTDTTTSKRYEYLRLCQSYRLGKNTRHKNIVSLGIIPYLDSKEKKKELADRIEELLIGNSGLFPKTMEAELEGLAQKFYKKIIEKKSIKQDGPNSKAPAHSNEVAQQDNQQNNQKDIVAVDMNSLRTEEVREIGAEWLCYQAIEQLGLSDFLLKTGMDSRWVNICLMHLIGKAVYPCSEHKAEQWIKESSAVASLFAMESEKITRHHLYQASKKLYRLKESIEPYLSEKTNDLYDLQDKIVLYDLTNTYFEGRKVASKKAKFGRSKEKRSDAKLISLALVTNAEGFVKYSKIYEGNISEPDTLEATITALSLATSSTGRKPMIVMDAGFSTDKNKSMLKKNGYEYLCVSRSKLKNYSAVDISALPVQLEDNRGNKIEVHKVEKTYKEDEKKGDNDTDTFLHIRSEQKAVKEVSMSAHFSSRYEEELNAMKAGLAKKGGTKKLDKVSERIGRIKERYPSANKHYQINIQHTENKVTDLTWKKIEIKTQPTDGVYFICSSQTTMDEKSMWVIYNTLTEIEATFRVLKTDLSIRPVHHQTDDNSEAHIFLGVLAYQVVASIRHQLKQKEIHHSWSTIVRKMNTQKSVNTSIITEDGKKILIKTCSQPVNEALIIYQTLNYKKTPFTRKKFVLPESEI